MQQKHRQRWRWIHRMIVLAAVCVLATGAHAAVRSADVVIGQSDFTGTQANQGKSTPDARSVNGPYGVNMSADGHVFVPDISNHRILIYNTPPTSNNAAADVVVGQSDFTSNQANQGNSTPSARTLNLPLRAFVADGKFFVVDGLNYRVLIYNHIPTSNNAAADVVIGQPDFTSNQANQGNSTPSARTLAYVFDAVVADGKLIVADRGNHRVLIYNHIPTSNNAAADVVIGQPDFTSNQANQGKSTPDARTLNAPSGLLVVDGKLLIADTENNRVLVYNHIPTSNNAAADVVIGQPDFTSTDDTHPSQTRSGGAPHPMAYLNGKLFIPEWRGNRVLVYDGVPTTNGAAAAAVLGQADFTSTTAGAGAQHLSHAASVGVGANTVAVSDIGNNRVLLFTRRPSVSVDYPTLSKERTITLGLTLQDADAVRVAVDGAALTAAPWRAPQATLPVTLAGDGKHTVTLQVRNAIGLTTETTFTVTVDATAPRNARKTIRAIGRHATTHYKGHRGTDIVSHKRRVTLRGRNTAAAGGRVDVYKRSGRTRVRVATATIGADGRWTVTLHGRRSGKPRTYYIRTYDAAGNDAGFSRRIRVFYDRKDPRFTGMTLNGAPIASGAHITVRPGDRLDFRAKDKESGLRRYIIKVRGKGVKRLRKQHAAYYIVPASLKPGTYRLTIWAQDRARNRRKAYFTMTVRAPRPAAAPRATGAAATAATSATQP